MKPSARQAKLPRDDDLPWIIWSSLGGSSELVSSWKANLVSSVSHPDYGNKIETKGQRRRKNGNMI